MVADSSDNNPKSNGGAEKKKERTAGQFFHIGEQGEQGDASAKVGAELHPLDYWVLDTGAAWMMTPRKELLDDVRAAPINEVCSASGHALKVAGAGRAAFKGADGKPVVLHDVLLVPDLNASLISLRKLAKAGVSTSTDGARWGAVWRGVCIPGGVQRRWRRWCEGVGQIWGDRLGNGTPTLGACGNALIEAAREGWSSQGSKKPLELVHMDLVGPLPVQGHKGERYFLTIVDDWSRLMWAYALKQKDHAASTIKEDWLPFVEKQAECVVKRIRTDRGGEFLGAEPTAWLKKQGIQRELITAYSPQSNGVAERANWTIMETARALLIESGLPLLILPHGYDPDEEDEPAYCFLAPAPEEPASMEEALAGPDGEKWLVSKDAEYQSLLENGTWDLVVLPDDKKAVQCKWVLRIKTDDKGQVTIYKSRLMAKGFMQKEKQDLNEIFALTAKPPTLRVLLADAAVSGKFIIQMDMSTAFLKGIFEEDVYMTQPPGYEDGTGRVCKLKKSIYGLKQAPRCWYQKLAAVLKEMGFRTSSCDESLFFKGEKEKLVLFLVYMDDILLFSSSMKEIQNVQQQLMKNLNCKTLGEVKYYLGMHVERDLDHRWLKLHQEKFIKELGEKYGIENERKVATPLLAEFKLVKAAEDERVKQKRVEMLKEKGERLGEGKLFLTCFTDATWASEKDDSSSMGGYICVVGGGPVSWRSKKQMETALSFVESHYMAMLHGVKQVIWLRRLLEEIGMEQNVATSLFCDSKGALGMARNAVLHGLNKHQDLDPIDGLHSTLRNVEGTLAVLTKSLLISLFTNSDPRIGAGLYTNTTLTPLPAPVLVRLADPSGGPVVARSSTVLPHPVVASGSLSALYLPSFSTNLVSTVALLGVTTTTPGGSSLYTLATEPPQVAASA
ncbi:unnamed protein product [Closterium sp. NIES-53]